MKLSNKNPELTVSGRELGSAINRVMSITQYVDCLETERAHLLAVIKGKAYVVGITPTAFACINLPTAKDCKPGTVSFDTKSVTGLIKNVSDITLSTDGSMLEIKGVKTRYRAKIEVQEVLESTFVRFEEASSLGEGNPLPTDVIRYIRSGVKHTRLENTYDEGEEMLSLIEVTGKSVRVISYDNFHASMYAVKVKSKRTMRLAIPTKAFSLIDKFIGDNDVAFEFTDSSVIVSCDDFIVSLPEQQVEDEIFRMIPDYIQSFKGPESEFSLTGTEMAPIKNMMVVSDKDTRMTIKIGKKSFDLSLETQSGSVSDSFKVKASGRGSVVHTDPRLFLDLLSGASTDEIQFSFFAGKKGQSSNLTLKSTVGDARLYQVCAVYDEKDA
jgi:DNA polymerase III sliding clamp (beta) subunit (PCNA family)